MPTTNLLTGDVRIVNEDGTPTLELIRFFDEFQRGKTNSIGSTVSGVAAAQAAADAAQTTADTAETNAQTGITNAATSQATGNNAQTLAIAAQATADTAETTGQTGIGNAATAQTTADTAETNAQTGITNAATAQTTADAADNDLVGRGVNLIDDAEFVNHVAIWTNQYNQSGLAKTVSRQIQDGVPTLKAALTGTPASNQQLNYGQADPYSGGAWLSHAIPLTSGDRIEAFADFEVVNMSKVQILVGFRNSAGAIISYGIGTNSSPGGDWSTGAPDRVSVFLTAPANTVAAVPIVVCKTDGGANPSIEFGNIFIGQAGATQTAHSPWVPGGSRSFVDSTEYAADVTRDVSTALEDTPSNYTMALVDDVWETVATIGPTVVNGVIVLKYSARLTNSMIGGTGAATGNLEFRVMRNGSTELASGSAPWLLNSAASSDAYDFSGDEFDITSGTHTYTLQARVTQDTEKSPLASLETRIVSLINLKGVTFK